MTTAPETAPHFPTTASGKRNWAFSAVHPGQQRPSFETVPQVEGSFGDLIDIINPLQHLPIVGSLYRGVTGDTMGAPARILGGLLFGGPLGFLAGLGGTLLAEISGSDAGEHVMAMTGISSNGTSTANAAALYASNSEVSAKSNFSTAIRI